MKKIISLKSFIFFFVLAVGCLVLFSRNLYAEDKIVAIVNNEVITQKDLNDFFNYMSLQLSREYKGAQLEDKISSMKQEMVDRLIEDRLILQEAKKEKIDIEPSRIKFKIDEIRQRYKSDTEFQEDLMRQGLNQADIERKIREQFLMFSLLEKKVRSKIKIQPSEVTAFYEGNKKDFVLGEEREVEAFALDNEDLATSFSYNLRNGSRVEELASRYPYTVNRVTLLRGEGISRNLEEIVFKLGINEVSSVLKIEDKYYVFRLLSINPSRQLTLIQSQDKIQAYLFERRMQKEMLNWLDDLKKKSYIKITQD